MLQKIASQIQKNKYAYFFSRLLALLLIVIVLDAACGGILRYFYFRQSSGWNYRTTYALEQTTDSLLIFGSSRAVQQYHPEVFENKLELSYYNCGRDGNFNLYNYAMLQAVLKRHTPKIIVLDFMKAQFKENPAEYDRLSILLPYYKHHPEIREIIHMRGPFERYKLLSASYPFNSTLFSTLTGNMAFNEKRNPHIKGYVIFDNTWDKPVKTITAPPPAYTIDSTFLRLYESFIQDCQKAGVQLYIVCSPYYELSPFTDYSIEKGKSIARQYNVDFFDYSKDSILISQQALFSDSMHLNDEGAKVFSARVAEDILRRSRR
ncbi:MAG TPA: SGNH/GDSL hydrolase family protein [Ferruginibacter sp.]|nr:SGNH/GDSL hydrolase family protein [Ferruginibacter sp.]HMP20203.1 SGNH/GDSL hydrolase family protein [Ferruginibacter sp.]